MGYAPYSGGEEDGGRWRVGRGDCVVGDPTGQQSQALGGGQGASRD